VAYRRRAVGANQLSLFVAPESVWVPWPHAEILGFDLETTGVDRFSDVPVSFALTTWRDGVVVDSATHLIDPGREIPEGASAIHGISTERARTEGWPLADAVELIAEWLVDASRRGVPVSGIKLDYDLTMLDVQCRALDGRGLAERGWTGPVLDALVLDRRLDKYRRGRRTLGHLCAHYGVEIDQAHDALADAQASIGVLLAMSRRFPELFGADPAELFAAQVGWHREWTVSYDAWRRSDGQTPLDPRESFWPVAPEVLEIDETAGAA
jgi:DNA polymerase III subunit epsilon